MKFNKKLFSAPVLIILGLALVSAVAVGIYFYQTSVTLTVTEARYSTDADVSISCYSGETQKWITNIYNYANVPLKAELTFEQTDNPNDVTYTITAPIIVDLPATSWTTQDVSITCDEITNAGVVTGILHYLPYKA